MDRIADPLQGKASDAGKVMGWEEAIAYKAAKNNCDLSSLT